MSGPNSIEAWGTTQIQAVGPGPKVCWGVKVNGSKRLRCGEPVDDPRVIEETMKLINEFLSRVEKHKAVLLSESATPFDDAINALSNWLGEIRAKIGESSDENIANLRKALLNSGKKMLELAEEAREKWLKTYKPELEELIERLRSGKARVIITGELLNKDKTFTAHLYVEDLAIEIDRVAKSGSITINISLMRLRETYVVVPRLFDNERLRAMQCGLMLTDGSIDKKGYPEMGTHQLWQVFAWSLAWPGKNHMHISGLSLNDGDVGIMWQLRATDHKGVFKDKSEVAEEASKLGDEEFLLFVLYAVFGDGSVITESKEIRLAMGHSKLELWNNIIERLRRLGFRKRNNDRHTVAYVVKSSKAIELAKRMLGNLVIKVLIEDLAQLPDAEKPRRLVALTDMEPKPKGRSMVEVAGIKMSVVSNNSGTIVLRAWRRDYGEAKAIWERLKRAGYDAGLRPSKGGFWVYMSMSEVKKDPNLTAKICMVLERIHEETVNKGNIERAWSIAKAMMYLGCPAQGPRAQ